MGAKSWQLAGPGIQMLKIVTARVPQAGHSVREKAHVPGRPGASTALVRTSTKMPRDGAGKGLLTSRRPTWQAVLDAIGNGLVFRCPLYQSALVPGGMQGTVEIDASSLQREPCFG